MDDTNWMEEFNLPDIPHADEFVQSTIKEKQLEQINISFNHHYGNVIGPTIKRVSFSDTIEIHYFKK